MGRLAFYPTNAAKTVQNRQNKPRYLFSALMPRRVGTSTAISARGQGAASSLGIAQLGITKAGNVYLRFSAGRVRQPCARAAWKRIDLRQWGLHLPSRGGKQSRNRAIVAVGRKQHRLRQRLHHQPATAVRPVPSAPPTAPIFWDLNPA